jgi:hypothetical protein
MVPTMPDQQSRTKQLVVFQRTAAPITDENRKLFCTWRPMDGRLPIVCKSAHQMTLLASINSMA